MTSQCDRRSIQIYATNLFFWPFALHNLPLVTPSSSNFKPCRSISTSNAPLHPNRVRKLERVPVLNLSVIQCFIAFLYAFNRQPANIPGMSVEEESEDSQIRTRFGMKDWMMPRVIGPAGPVPGRKPPLALSQNLTPHRLISRPIRLRRLTRLPTRCIAAQRSQS